MTTPGAFGMVLLALAAYRLWRIAALDDVTAPIRRRVLGVTDQEHKEWVWAVDKLAEHHFDAWRLDPVNDSTESWRVGYWLMVFAPQGWQPPDWARVSAPPFSRAALYRSRFVRCPWCLGFWVSVALWLAYQPWPRATLALCVPLALSAAAGWLGKLDKEA